MYFILNFYLWNITKSITIFIKESPTFKWIKKSLNLLEISWIPSLEGKEIFLREKNKWLRFHYPQLRRWKLEILPKWSKNKKMNDKLSEKKWNIISQSWRKIYSIKQHQLKSNWKISSKSVPWKSTKIFWNFKLLGVKKLPWLSKGKRRKNTKIND